MNNALRASLSEQFGRYRILKTIGEGGMGAVYLAQDTQLGRQVALKVPHFSPQDGPEVIDRFYREARAAATLDHPNICPIYDVGQIDGVHYLTMPYIEGKTLSDLIDPAKPMSPRQAARVAYTLARVLGEVHGRGFIHRDLKPANVIVNRRDELVIMDFGLARPVDAGDARLTKTGVLLGTPSYMAPEQVEGDPSALGPGCDIYSLGVILYEMLAGRRPFVGSVEAVLGLKLARPPEPPSAFRPELDPGLETICLKALAIKPADRHATMAEFALALGDYLVVREGKIGEERVGNDLGDRRLKSSRISQSGSDSVAAPFGAGLKPRVAGTLLPTPSPEPTSYTAAAAGIVFRVITLICAICIVVIVGVYVMSLSPTGMTKSVVMTMVRIEPGTFTMGSNEYGDEHTVRIIKPFSLAAHEVTQGQYQAVMGENPSFFKGSDDLPVERVSWLDAVRFCNNLSEREKRKPCYQINGEKVTIVEGNGYRLPTEAEWEYACHAGSTARYPFGDNDAELGEYAWFRGNSDGKTHPVGLKQPNRWGLYDMLGNVWEWCQDGYDADYYKKSPPDDPPKPFGAHFRVFRGGSWYDFPWSCRPALRFRLAPVFRYRNLGFRLAAVQAD